MIAIIDYGMGNLRSVQKALETNGAQAKITQSQSDILAADKIILPGVGAIQPAMEKLQDLGLIDAIQKVIADGKPFLGICLGLQLLFEKSDEGGQTKGLGILKGSVKKFQSLIGLFPPNSCDTNLSSLRKSPMLTTTSAFNKETVNKVPHMGWNQLIIKDKKCKLFENIADLSCVYFCHSYYVEPKDKNIAVSSTDYGVEFASSVIQNNIFGVQFHPEKSQQTGLQILKNFINIKT